jgi:cystathionine gamma-synthase
VANPGRPRPLRNLVVEPAWHNVEFFYRDTEDWLRYREGDPTLGRYGRYDNPSWRQVERRIAELEGWEGALLLPSGMAALNVVALASLRSGDTLAYCDHCYYQIKALFHEVMAPLGVRLVALDQSDPERFDGQLCRAASDPGLRVVFVESPSNPHLYLVDLERVRHRIGPERLLVVDTTFASPLFLSPCRLGADLVVYSCTKYVGGHGDLLAGAVAGAAEQVARVRRIRDISGTIPDAGVAFLLNRSLDTLPLRMRHYGETAGAVARHLEAQPWVRRVWYTGLESHPHATLVRRYLRGHGGVIAFELDADEATTSSFVDALQVPYMASSFGSTRTLVEQMSIFTYYRLDADQRQSLGITDSLIRLSIGMDEAAPLIADLDEAAARTLAKARSA